MKPTVGRIIHTRIDGFTRAGIIVGCDPLSDDTRNGPVPLAEVRLFMPGVDSAHVDALLYDSEADAPPGGFYWPERVP